MSKHVDPQTWIGYLQGQIDFRVSNINELKDEIASLYEEIAEVEAMMEKYTWPDDYVTGLSIKESQ